MSAVFHTSYSDFMSLIKNARKGGGHCFVIFFHKKIKTGVSNKLMRHTCEEEGHWVAVKAFALAALLTKPESFA